MSKDNGRIIYLKGDRVSLGILTPDDAEILCHFLNNEEMREFLSNYLPIYPAGEKKWLEELPDRAPHDFVFGIIRNEDGALVGNIGLHRVEPKDRRAIIGIFIGDSSNRGHGYGQEAGELLKRFAFDTLNLRKLRYEVYAHNERSLKLAANLGAIEEGRLVEEHYANGRYADTLILAIFRPEEGPQPLST